MRITGTLIGRIILILFFSYLNFKLLRTSSPWLFVDGANLLIHESGHLLFSAFGQFLAVLGGSLTQIMVPLIVFVYFLLRREYFACSAVLFWIGDNFINVSVYMKDAIVMQLPLVGMGDTVIHDWNWIFSQMGILSSSGIIGSTVFFIGAICAITSLLGMAFFTLVDSVGN